jgi:hypothetical protein
MVVLYWYIKKSFYICPMKTNKNNNQQLPQPILIMGGIGV